MRPMGKERVGRTCSVPEPPNRGRLVPDPAGGLVKRDEKAVPA